MKAAIAALVTGAIRANIFDDGQVYPPGGPWRDAKVIDRRGGQAQAFDNAFTTRFVTGDDHVDFPLADWPTPSCRPTKDWLVRYADGRVVKLTEAAAVKDGIALRAPVLPFTGAPPA